MTRVERELEAYRLEKQRLVAARTLIWDRVCAAVWNCSVEHATAVRQWFTGYLTQWLPGCSVGCTCPMTQLRNR